MAREPFRRHLRSDENRLDERCLECCRDGSVWQHQENESCLADAKVSDARPALVLKSDFPEIGIGTAQVVVNQAENLLVGDFTLFSDHGTRGNRDGGHGDGGNTLVSG